MHEYEFDHLFTIGFSISTNKHWDDLTAEDLLTAIEIRLRHLRACGDEVLESVELIETLRNFEE
jgi:hypothetical protein